jgi:hypothetical protein
VATMAWRVQMVARTCWRVDAVDVPRAFRASGIPLVFGWR